MTIILILLILIVLLLAMKVQQKKRGNYAPGPFPWPLVGNLFYLRNLTRDLGAQHLALKELSNRYKSNLISLQVGTSYILVVNDPKLIHLLLNKDEYSARPWDAMAKLRNMGLKKGITMNDGFVHRELRGWALYTLKDIGFSGPMKELLLNELRLILDRLKEGGVRYMYPVIAPGTINMIWTLVTGKPFFNDDVGKLHLFLSLITRRAKLLDMSGGMLLIPGLRYIAPNMTGYKTVTQLNKKLKELLMGTINEHKEQYREGSETDFIDIFLREMSHESKHSMFEDEQLFITLLDFFIAGFGTTTPILEFLFLAMANHQDVQRKLHEEIDRVIGSNELPDLNDKKEMHYTKAVIKECGRRWMILPVISRRTTKDTTVENYVVPEGTTVLFNLAANNHDASIYADPMSFKPERFLKDGVFQSDKNLILFGKGKRRCFGELVAESAVFIFFVGVMQKYRFLPPNDQTSIKIEMDVGLTTIPKPYEILVVPR